MKSIMPTDSTTASPSSDCDGAGNDSREPLDEAREQIDAIDRRLVELLSQRQSVVDDIAELKQSGNREVRDEARERALLDRLRRLAGRHDVPKSLVEGIYREILDHSVARQHEKLSSRYRRAS
jgi:chorismate mutase